MPLLDERQDIARKVNLAVLKGHRFLIGIMLLTLALRMLWLKTMIEADEGFFGYDAMLWSKGYLPYVHSSPTKGPLQYLLYLIPIYFFGNTIIPIRIINNILFLISVLVLYMIAKDWYGKRAGLIAALFYSIFMNAPVFQAIQAITESTSMPFVIFSIYFCNKYLKNGGKNLLLFSGASMSAALLIRQNQAIGVILLMLMIITQYKFFREGSHTKLLLKNFMISISILIAGVILPVLVIIVYFWSIGALYNLIECTVLNYFRFGYFSFPSAPLLSELLMIAEGLPLWLLCFFGFIVCVLRRNKHDVFSMAWLLLFLGIASMPPHFSRHFSPVIAPASVLSAVGLGSVLESIKSSSVREFLGNYRRNITSIFIISLLIFSFVPPIFLQVKQHPNLNFYWGFINASYFGGAPGLYWSYDRQVELANYLKSHTSENDKILIHDFWATPYWLSGHRAPSKYISTVQVPGIFTITDEEFKRLATMVEDGSFEYIVIFYPLSVPYDSIVYNVLNKYFYVKNIENAHIFSKYNSKGEYVYYSFREKLSNASKEYKLQNGMVRDIEKDFRKTELIPKINNVIINDDIRRTILQHPIPSVESLIRYDNIFIPSDSKLNFGIGIEPWTWNRKEGDGVEFKIFIQCDGRIDELFREYINPKHVTEDRRWHDFEVSLTKYRDKIVDIIFVTTPGPANDICDDWANWSDPKIYIKGK